MGESNYDIAMRTQRTKPYSIPTKRHRAGHSSLKTQTTLRLPRRLYEQAKTLASAQEGVSINDFIVAALSTYVRAIERKAIDRAFEGMASDKRYQRETLRIMREFAASDAETLALSERDLVGA